ncbi:MAG: AIR synthase-related protein, partial [Bartonella sp.]|nr:AIR synthase-related protein [Bartonella sp.]
PPCVDLYLEKKHGEFVRNVIQSSIVHAAHDIYDGLLAIDISERVIKADKGIKIELSNQTPHHAELFGEDQGRYLLAVKPNALDNLKMLAQTHTIPLIVLGSVEGDTLDIKDVFTLSFTELTQAYVNW